MGDQEEKYKKRRDRKESTVVGWKGGKRKRGRQGEGEGWG